MNLSFRPVDLASDVDCAWLARVRNDPGTRRMYEPNRPGRERAPVTIENLRADARDRGAFDPVAHLLVLRDGIEIVGEIALYLNPPHRRSTGAIVAWPTILIGDPSDRRQGLGTFAADHLASLARDAGATHVEAGVFEFNVPIRALLEKKGFREIARIEGFTHDAGRAWAEIRYERALAAGDIRIV